MSVSLEVIFLSDVQNFTASINYQKCSTQVGETFASCMVECDNLDNNNLTECEKTCTKEWKHNQARCPCQVSHTA